MTAYTIIDTGPTVYQDKSKGIVNGVLVRFRMDAYDEVHEVRIPEMKTAIAKAAIEAAIAERDALAQLGQSE